MAGIVYSTGLNNHGQLGLEESLSSTHVPLQVTFPFTDDYIVQVDCGDFHSAAVTQRGALYTWYFYIQGKRLASQIHSASRGHGLYGQLGHSCEISRVTPLQVQTCGELIILYVACGSYHTAVVTCAFFRG